MIRDIKFKNDIFSQTEVEILPFEIIKERQKANPISPYEPHKVHFYCLNFILKGENGIHHIDFVPYEYTTGDVLITSKTQVHFFETMPQHEGILLAFTEKFLIELSSNFHFLTYQLNNNFLHHPIIKITSREFDTIITLLKLARKEQQNRSKNSLEIIKSYVKIILTKVLSQHEMCIRKKTPEIENFIRFQKLVNQNIFCQRNVCYYANQLGLNPKHLSAVTKKTTGKSAKEYLNAVLVLEAKRLLKCSNLSVKEISYRLGFHEPTNFTKFFKKHTTLSPSQFTVL